MTEPSAYIIGKYKKGLLDAIDEPLDQLEGADDGDIYVVMKNTAVNMALAKKLLTNYND